MLKLWKVSSKVTNHVQEAKQGINRADVILNRLHVTNFPQLPEKGKVHVGSDFIESMEKSLGYCLAGIIVGKFSGI